VGHACDGSEALPRPSAGIVHDPGKREE